MRRGRAAAIVNKQLKERVVDKANLAQVRSSSQSLPRSLPIPSRRQICSDASRSRAQYAGQNDAVWGRMWFHIKQIEQCGDVEALTRHSRRRFVTYSVDRSFASRTSSSQCIAIGRNLRKQRQRKFENIRHKLLIGNSHPLLLVSACDYSGDHGSDNKQPNSVLGRVVRFFKKEEDGKEEDEEEGLRKIQEEAINYKKEAANNEMQHDQMRSVTWLGLGSNVVLGSGKAIIGYMSHSQAMMADAAHSFTDAISDVVALWALHMMRLPHNAQYPYGHGKFETVGTFLVAITLAGTGIGLGSHSIGALLEAAPETIPGSIAIYGALGSILFKELLYQVTAKVGKRNNSKLLIANAWHHRTDAISSVVALLGIVGARLGVPWLDPIAGLAVAGMIVKIGVEMGITSLRELTDCALDTSMTKYMVRLIQTVEGVVEYRQMRARRMGTYIIVDVEIQVDPRLSVSAAHQVAQRVRLTLLDQVPQVHEVLVHVDPEPPVEETLETLMRSQSEIFEDVAAKVDMFPQVAGISYVCCHYYARRLTVEVDVIFNESSLSLHEVQEISKDIQKEILTIKDIHHADVMVNLSLQSLTQEKEWVLYLKEMRKMKRLGSLTTGRPTSQLLGAHSEVSGESM